MQTILTTRSRSKLSPARTLPADRRSRRRGVDLLSALFLLFILQTGLAPYDFLSFSATTSTQALFSCSIDRVTRPDILSNIALYAPYGLLVCVALATRLRRKGAAIGLTLAGAVILSVGIEWMQSFSPSRVSSLIDVAANVLGAGIGIILSICAGPLLPKLAAAARTELVLRPDGTMLKAYVGLLCIVAAAPFDLSFDVGQLRKSWKSACAAMASLRHGDVSTVALPDARFGARSVDYGRWATQKRWARWGAESVSFAVFAGLATAWLRREYAFGRATSGVLCLWVGFLLAVGLSVLQLPIHSRGFDARDVVFRALGLLVGCGSVWRGAFQRDAVPVNGRHTSTLRRTPWMHRLGWAAGIYVTYTGLVPIGVDFLHASEAVSWSTLVPFSTYPIGRFNDQVGDAMEKLASFALLAGLFAAAGRTTRGRDLRRELVGLTSRCAGLALAIEVVQMVIPPRTPAVTDVLLAAAGAALGCVLQDRLAMLCSEASHRRAKLAGTVAVHPPPQRAFTPLDDLIATLAEPQANAPVESEVPQETVPNPRDT